MKETKSKCNPALYCAQFGGLYKHTHTHISHQTSAAQWINLKKNSTILGWGSWAAMFERNR